MLRARLVYADQHALLILAHVGEAFEIDHHRQFALERRDLGNRLGDEIMVLDRRERQIEPGHAPHLLGPKSAGVDDMLGVDDALLGDEIPALVGALLEFEDAIVLDDFGAAFFRRARIGPDRACGVEIAFAVGPHAAEHALDVDDRAKRFHFLRRDEADVLDADRLEAPIRTLQPFPARRRGGDMHAAGHMHADVLAGFFLDLAKQVDRVGLQARPCWGWRSARESRPPRATTNRR